jgi:hypothetical protein
MEIIKGKLNAIYPLGGKTYGDLVTDKKEVIKQIRLSKKSLWALLRQHYGYKINAEIRKQKKGDFSDFAIKKMSALKETEKMQFIMDDEGECAVAVASLKHSTKQEEYVYDIIENVLQKKKIEIVTEKGITGRVFYLKSHPTFKVGLQVSGGDLITMKAIKITPFAKIMTCLNPLSWLGIDKMWYAEKTSLEIISIRRFEKISHIEDRIKNLLTKSMGVVEKVNKMLEQGKKTELTEIQTKKLLLVMCKSYGIGLKAIQSIYKRWEMKEEKTIYGLAMACSYFASHKKLFKKNAIYSTQNISSIAGALLIIKKVKIMRVIEKKIKSSKELKDELEELEED